MRCLSVRQPMAAAIAAEVKLWENRSRRVIADKRLPCWIGLHASQTWWGDIPQWPECPTKEQAPRSVILGAMLIGGQAHIDDMSEPLNRWASGPICMRIDAYISLPEPIPAKGKLGLWLPEPDASAALLALVRRYV